MKKCPLLITSPLAPSRPYTCLFNLLLAPVRECATPGCSLWAGHQISTSALKKDFLNNWSIAGPLGLKWPSSADLYTPTLWNILTLKLTGSRNRTDQTQVCTWDIAIWVHLRMRLIWEEELENGLRRRRYGIFLHNSWMLSPISSTGICMQFSIRKKRKIQPGWVSFMGTSKVKTYACNRIPTLVASLLFRGILALQFSKTYMKEG